MDVISGFFFTSKYKHRDLAYSPKLIIEIPLSPVTGERVRVRGNDKLNLFPHPRPSP
jgi:predicted N-acyltransferase